MLCHHVTSCGGNHTNFTTNSMYPRAVRSQQSAKTDMHLTAIYFTAKISINTSNNTYGHTRHQNPKFTIFKMWGVHPQIWGPPNSLPLHFDVWHTTQSSLSSLQSIFKFLFPLLFSVSSSGQYKELNYRYEVHVGPKWQHYCLMGFCERGNKRLGSINVTG